LHGISQHLNGMPSIEFKVFKGKNVLSQAGQATLAGRVLSSRRRC